MEWFKNLTRVEKALITVVPSVIVITGIVVGVVFGMGASSSDTKTAIDAQTANKDPTTNGVQTTKKTTETDEEYSCLITDDHKIPIGEHIFWDWED